MPLKLNIAMSRKVGEPNYGSRGATVGLEMEVDSTLADQPQQLHERIPRLFRLANESIDKELSGQPVPPANSNGSVRPATAAQIRAIHAIAAQRNINVVDELRNRFGLYRADELTLEQASQVIDAMKSPANGVVTQQ